MRRRLLLILAAVVRPGDEHFRLIKYSEFPPLSLMTIAGLTPDNWDVIVRDEHVESSEIDGPVDLVGKILTASFHILTPLPGTRTFARLEAEDRLLHRDWCSMTQNASHF